MTCFCRLVFGVCSSCGPERAAKLVLVNLLRSNTRIRHACKFGVCCFHTGGNVAWRVLHVLVSVFCVFLRRV